MATLKLGQARGIAMLVPARAGLVVAEYAPNAVKKAVIGVGHGDKKQIHMMVKVLLPKATFDTEHAADALAIAICHAHHRRAWPTGWQCWRKGSSSMIGKLKGTLDEIDEDHCLVDVDGVGYVVIARRARWRRCRRPARR